MSKKEHLPLSELEMTSFREAFEKGLVRIQMNNRPVNFSHLSQMTVGELVKQKGKITLMDRSLRFSSFDLADGTPILGAWWNNREIIEANSNPLAKKTESALRLCEFLYHECVRKAQEPEPDYEAFFLGR